MVGRIAIALCALLLPGCQREQLDDCITSAGPQRTEQRSPGAFHSIDLDDRIDLVYTTRAVGTLTVTAGANLLGQISTVVEDSVLHIGSNMRCNWVRSFKPRITVEVPITQVRGLTLRGSGTVSCTDTIRTDVLRIEQRNGQGSVDLALDVLDCTVGLHTGAGDVKLSGRCSGRAELYSGIWGAIDASGMRTRFVGINNSGIADIRCWATESLEVQLLSRGDVYYRGDPPFLQSQLVGTGRLLRLD